MVPEVKYENGIDEEPEVFDRISMRRGILAGKPCIEGSRISVQIVLEWIASGGSIAEIVREYPFLSEEDVRQAVRFAASRMSAA